VIDGSQREYRWKLRGEKSETGSQANICVSSWKIDPHSRSLSLFQSHARLFRRAHKLVVCSGERFRSITLLWKPPGLSDIVSCFTPSTFAIGVPLFRCSAVSISQFPTDPQFQKPTQKSAISSVQIRGKMSVHLSPGESHSSGFTIDIEAFLSFEMGWEWGSEWSMNFTFHSHDSRLNFRGDALE
jgi:hypothetical protein